MGVMLPVGSKVADVASLASATLLDTFSISLLKSKLSGGTDGVRSASRHKMATGWGDVEMVNKFQTPIA